MERIIITHAGRPHMDETLAIAMLINHYHSNNVAFKIMRVPHKHIPDIERSTCQVWVDVGKQYNPRTSNFDHHQDPTLRSSAALVRDYLTNLIKTMVPSETNVDAYLDYRDRHGPRAANELNILTADDAESVHKSCEVITGVLDMWWTDNCSDYMTPVYGFNPYTIIAGAVAGRCVTAHTLKRVVTALTNHLPSYVDRVGSDISRNKVLTLVDISNLCTWENSLGLDIRTIDPSKDNATKFDLEDIGVDYLIRADSRDDGRTQVIANTHAGATVNNLRSLFNQEDIKFVHNNGFLMVIDKPLLSLRGK